MLCGYLDFIYGVVGICYFHKKKRKLRYVNISQLTDSEYKKELQRLAIDLSWKSCKSIVIPIYYLKHNKLVN